MMADINFEKIEIEALIQVINAAAIRGSDSRIIANLLDKLSNALKERG